MKKFVKLSLAACLALSMTLGSMNCIAAEGGNSKFFTDVNSTSYGWSAEFVDDIASRQIASGVGNNKFNPGGTINRGDFAIFLSKAMELNDAGLFSYSYPDVEESDYFNQYVLNCAAAGLIETSGAFYPDMAITRSKAMLYIYRGLLNAKLVLNNGTTDLSMYKDGSTIKNLEEQLAIGTLTKMGILNGSSDGNIHATDTMTRAEMATVFSKTCSYMDSAKQVVAEKEEAKQEQAAADEQAKKDEDSNAIKGGKVEEVQHFADDDASLSSVTMDITSQDSPLVSMTGADLTVEKSNLTAYNYPAIALETNGKADVDSTIIKANETSALTVDETSNLKLVSSNVSVETKNSSIFGAVVEGGSLSLKNTIFKTTNITPINLKGGSTLNITNESDVSVSDKSLAAIDVQGDDIVEKGNTNESNTNSTSITIDGSTITTNKGTLLQLKDCVTDLVIKNNAKINCPYIINSAGNKTKQSADSVLNITLNSQQLEADIQPDYDTKVTLNIGAGSSYKGAIDADGYQTVSVKLPTDGKLEITNTSYVNGLELEDLNFNNINLNGNILYYNRNNSKNFELNNETYTMPNGGDLVPYDGATE